MKRNSALVYLGLISTGALLCVIWGYRDLSSWVVAIAQCQDVIAIEPSSFWFIGFLAISGLIIVAFFKSTRAHAIILVLLSIWYLGAPTVAYMYTAKRAQTAGYDTSNLKLFTMDRIHLELIKCEEPKVASQF